MTVSTTAAWAVLSLSLARTSDAFSFCSKHGSMYGADFGIGIGAFIRTPFFDSNAFRRIDKLITDGNKNRITHESSFTTTSMFSTSSDQESTNTNNDNESMHDVSISQGDIDFMSVNDIDWAEMDPLHGIPFDEYEKKYLQGEAKGDDLPRSDSNCDASFESIMTEWDDSVPTLNHISLVGRVGNPPEARYFDNPLDSGSKNSKPNVVVSMSLALPRYYSAWEREQHGIEYGQEETDWYNLEVWGVLAEFALKNVQKGSRIGVVGSVDTDYYRNKQTALLSTNPKILVQDLDILESKMEANARRNNMNFGSNNADYSSRDTRYNSNYSNDRQGREEERGPSFFTDDEDDDDDDSYGPSRGNEGLSGGFFDPM
mmetsp:Transcript_23122/g.54666  ORF Transcript_23122/g.54666 Transcript_23122/m.54666 type:complete len:372 (+) Transcript_23122:169-1284(+)